MSSRQIEWYRTNNQESIDAWIAGEEDLGPVEEASDKEYFVYGEAQLPVTMRSSYLLTTLQISEVERSGDGVYLLNPRVVTADGEWEAWFHASWLPGAVRYKSFWDLMQGEFN